MVSLNFVTYKQEETSPLRKKLKVYQGTTLDSVFFFTEGIEYKVSSIELGTQGIVNLDYPHGFSVGDFILVKNAVTSPFFDDAVEVVDIPGARSVQVNCPVSTVFDISSATVSKCLDISGYTFRGQVAQSLIASLGNVLCSTEAGSPLVFLDNVTSLGVGDRVSIPNASVVDEKITRVDSGNKRQVLTLESLISRTTTKAVIENAETVLGIFTFLKDSLRGKVTARLLSDDTQSFPIAQPARSFYYDIKYSTPDKRLTLVYGSVVILPDVTPSSTFSNSDEPFPPDGGGGETTQPTETFTYREPKLFFNLHFTGRFLNNIQVSDYPRRFRSVNPTLPLELNSVSIVQNGLQISLDEENSNYNIYPNKSFQQMVDDGDISVKWFMDSVEVVGETNASLALDENNGDQGKSVYAEVTNNVDNSVVTSNSLTIEEILLLPLLDKSFGSYNFSNKDNTLLTDLSSNNNDLVISVGNASDFSFSTTNLPSKVNTALEINSNDSGYYLNLGSLNSVTLSMWFYIEVVTDIMWVTVESSNRSSTQFWGNDGVFMTTQWGFGSVSDPNFSTGWNHVIWWWGSSGAGHILNGNVAQTMGGNSLNDIQLRIGNAVRRNTAGTKIADLMIFSELTNSEKNEILSYYELT